ncbi:MAG: sulfotransferase [Fimbriimonas sp.]|nr:sulfotransferase [Fimbriimonas sp.]
MNVDPVAAQVKRARADYLKGDLASARAITGVLALSHPERADVQLANGMVLMASGEPEPARYAFLRVIELDPSSQEAWYGATFITLNEREFTEAERLARRYVEAAPNSHRAYYLLAAALRGQDRPEEALDAVDCALQIKSDDVDCLVLKARVLKELRMPGLSVEIYRQALAIRPTPAAAIDLAKMLIRESRPESAIEVLGGMESTLSALPAFHALLGEAYTMTRQFDLASEHWGSAKHQSASRSGIDLQRAKAEIAVGRFELAEEILQDLISSGVDVPSAFLSLTSARKMTEQDRSLLERMDALARSGSCDPLRQSELAYGLGKSFDDLGEYEAAIGQFDEANRICLQIYRPRRSFDRDQASAFTDFLIQNFTRENLDEWKDAGDLNPLPAFVVGMMRSGTTLTETILNAHSKIRGIGEQAFWTERAIEFVFKDEGGLHVDMPMVRRFASDYLASIDSRDASIRYVVDKNPANFELLGVLHAAMPNSKLIHLNRHPVDNLLSLWMTPMSGNVAYASSRDNLVFAYREYQRLWEHWQEVLPQDRFKTVRYEELTGDPQTTIRSMLQFLELEVEEACFAPEQNKRAVLTPSVFQVRQPIHRGSQERWRRYEPWLGVFAECLN